MAANYPKASFALLSVPRERRLRCVPWLRPLWESALKTILLTAPLPLLIVTVSGSSPPSISALSTSWRMAGMRGKRLEALMAKTGAENNLAERRLRPLVIARKLSFGSQSTDGLRIRETLLTVMDTLRLRWDDPVGKLMEAFEATAANPEADVTDILFPKKPAAGVGCLAARESAGCRE